MTCRPLRGLLVGLRPKASPSSPWQKSDHFRHGLLAFEAPLGVESGHQEWDPVKRRIAGSAAIHVTDVEGELAGLCVRLRRRIEPAPELAK